MTVQKTLALGGLGAILGAAALFAASPAPAQVFGGHNSNAPVNFNAGRIELQERADRVILSGAVRVDQGGLSLNSARMTIAYTNTGSVDVNRIDATGGVTIRKNGDVATGNVAIYDLNRRIITLIGGVNLKQANGNRLSGGRVVIDLASGRSSIDGRSAGGASGPNSAGANSAGDVGTNENGRVTGTFTVPQRGN